MKTKRVVGKLRKEIAVISEISKELPLPYKTIIDAKIIGFKVYLNKILIIETGKGTNNKPIEENNKKH